MKKTRLGQTQLEVSEMCFGVLPMVPLQARISEEAGGELILAALRQGVNFIDTAETYNTYPHIRRALDQFNGEVIIATKSPAHTYADMERSIELALKSLGREQIEIFLLHAARVTPAVFEERAGAFQCLVDYKEKGILKAIGISTHVVPVVRRAAEIPNVDIIFPIVNKLGMGIVDGSIDEMLQAIRKAHDARKGLYGMKALAGGHLITDLKEAFDFVRQIPELSSIAVGMVKLEELEMNLKIFNDEELSANLTIGNLKASKRLHILTNICRGCGTCVETCPNAALSLVDGKAQVDRDSCILCGYCNPVCPEFALRVV
ncbi:aldo/keto reductase [Desulfitobacterium metallireducens]|uniref:Aldo/keto reductase n=1 Tax=Desulfitobacterium metallireducens DSM 15288 TaxID=871968 RepID=W0EA68_9FIRM|nr:aldo/keto reductase [Desulfitobacterium metallireducens]AHF06423.1 aldo/keto reductase [Desulfitobacterium metallireducens DSM 15288]